MANRPRAIVRCLKTRWTRLGGMVAAGAVLAQFGGCLPDNAIRSVFAEQITQTFALGTQGATQLIFGLPDAILNLLVFNLLSQLTGT